MWPCYCSLVENYHRCDDWHFAIKVSVNRSCFWFMVRDLSRGINFFWNLSWGINFGCWISSLFFFALVWTDDFSSRCDQRQNFNACCCKVFSFHLHGTNLEPLTWYQDGYFSDFLLPVDVDGCSTVKLVLWKEKPISIPFE